ncbi:MAG: hypothetical protein K2X52_00685 [Mycobacteriaceae bacterium]|jgi:hypothetical protein|nr:hypothetical protein [Mycobacteriaceae bacterium]
MHTARSAMPAGLALTTAAALAFTPLMVPAPPLRDITVPSITVPRLQLAAAINQADVTALVDNLNAALNSASITVTNLVDVPGQTLSNALGSAVSLNNTLWDGLIASTDNKPLLAILKTLKTSAGNGLSQLSTSVDAANGTAVLTTGQLTDLLTSTITGSLGSVLHAVATVVNNPLALPSYTGLINTPIDIAGLLLTQGIGTANNLGANVLSVTNTVVTGVTAQISNALDTFNGLVNAGKSLTDVDLINGLLTAVQGIVSAPVTAAVAAVNGASTTIVNAATTVLGRAADGASDVVATWIGDGTRGGAIQSVINTIGSAPLSAASYTNAISVLVGAGISTATVVGHSVGSLASVPFSAAADITTAGANVITSLTSGLATAASGIMQAVGLPSIVYNLPHALAATVNGLVNGAAFAANIGFRTIATVLDIGSAITEPFAAPAAKTVTLQLATAKPAAATEQEGETAAASDSTADDTATTPTTNKHELEDVASGSAAADPDATAVEPVTADLATEPATAVTETPTTPTAATEEQPAAAATTDSAASGTTDTTAGEGAPSTAPKADTPTAGTKTATAASTTSAATKDSETSTGKVRDPKPGTATDTSSTASAGKRPTTRSTDKDDDTTTRATSTPRTPAGADHTTDTASTSTTPKHASDTSPRHAAASDSTPKHAAAA